MSIPRFSFFQYVDNIKELISDNFSSLNTVTFAPSDEGDDAQYSDVGVPAFLMSFQDPIISEGGVPMRGVDVVDPDGGALSAREGYYMSIRVRVQGSLLLPRFKTAGQNAQNLNMSIAVFQAAANIASLIYAQARGWNCQPAKIESISYEPDSDYHIAIIDWSHEATVGSDDGDSDDLRQVFADLFPCPDQDAELTVDIDDDDNLILEVEE